MSIPGSSSPLFFQTAAAGAAGTRTLQKSVRFNQADSAGLYRNFSSAGNRRTWTFSCWIKKSGLYSANSYQTIFESGVAKGAIQFDSIDQLRVYDGQSGGATIEADNIRMRDLSAWYHLVIKYDTTQSTATDRVVIYINGVDSTKKSATFPSQNYESAFSNSQNHYVGRGTSGNYLHGYLADVYFIDGTAHDATDFGQYDDNGVWQCKTFSGSFGSNGFHLFDFENESGIGNDASGNDNDFTVSNIQSGSTQSIANATGGLPILNTDSTGSTVQSGVRSDSNANKLSLAVAGGTASGLNITDQIPSGRGSSNASITNDGVTGTTSSSFFYGGSATVGNGDNLAISDHDDFVLGSTFTIEFWAKPDSNATGNEKTIVSHGINASNGYVIMVGQSGAVFRTNGTTDLTYSRTATTDWTHFAFVANSGNKKIFANGTEVASASGSANDDRGDTTYVGSPDVFNSNYRFTGEFQDVRIYKALAKYTSSFTVPNISYASLGTGDDVLFDVPTNSDTSDTGVGGEVSGNYATWNPLANGLGCTVSEGALRLSGAATSAARILGTIGVSSGKWYFEVTYTATDNYTLAGVGQYFNTYYKKYPGQEALSYAFDFFQGKKYNNGSQTTHGSSLSAGDIFMCALDLDNNKIFFGKNGTFFDSGNPATGANPSYTITAGTYYIVGRLNPAGFSSNNAVIDLNAGQRSYAYAAPSGFKSWNTSNLPASTIADGRDYFLPKAYTGNGGTQSITTGFSPDFVWLKSRADGDHHGLFDIQRGALYRLTSDYTYASTSRANSLTAFNSDGFSVGSSGDYNGSSEAHVAWSWNGGSSTVSNTSGARTSTVRASQTAGFSIVKWTANGSGGTVGHGLGATPEFIIAKNVSNAGQWPCYIKDGGPGKYVYLNSDIDMRTYSHFWGGISPTSSTFNTGTDGDVASNGSTVIAYCFTPIRGFSAMGFFSGTASADGVFVPTDFRVAWLMTKNLSASGDWLISDSARSTHNVSDEHLAANTANTESSYTSSNLQVDLLSNGFKIRGTGAARNGNEDSIFYLAFASNPFEANGGLAR